MEYYSEEEEQKVKAKWKSVKERETTKACCSKGKIKKS